MGLLNKDNTTHAKGNNPDNPDCLCDSRGVRKFSDGTIQEVNQNQCSSDCNSDEEIIAMALKVILDKIDTIEKGQEFLIKKVIK